MERILEDLEAVVEDGDERECVYDLFSIGGTFSKKRNASKSHIIRAGYIYTKTLIDFSYPTLNSIGSLQSSFPQPTSREYVLETFDPSDMSHFTSESSSPMITAGPIAGGWHNRPLQRRMYACFKESEVRIVEAIAKDGMYM